MAGDRRARSTMAVFLAGPIIWFAHFMVVYLVAEAGCTGNGPGLELFDPPVPTTVTLVATALATPACLLMAAWGFRRWRASTEPAGGAAESSQPTGSGGGRGSLAFAGFLLSLLSGVSILLVGLPALVLPAC